MAYFVTQEELACFFVVPNKVLILRAYSYIVRVYVTVQYWVINGKLPKVDQVVIYEAQLTMDCSFHV